MSRRLMYGNKGMFFSLISILVLIVIALQFVGQQKLAIESESEALQARFEIANNLVNDVEQNILPRLVEADVGTALVAIARAMNDTDKDKPDMNNGAFLADKDSLTKIVNASVLGTLEDTPFHNLVRQYVGNATLTNQTRELHNISLDQLRIDVNVTPENVVIYQDDTTGAEFIGATMQATLFVDAEFATWTRDLTIDTLVSIEGLLDPYILVRASRDASSPYALNGLDPSITFFSGPFTKDKFQRIVDNRTYQEDAEAPGFLQRFYNDMTRASLNKCCGMESVISLNNHYQHFPARVPETLRRKSFIDYCYWEGKNSRCDTLSLFKQSYWVLWTDGSPSVPDIAAPSGTSENTKNFQLMLDSYHLEKYGVLAYRTDANECRCAIESTAGEAADFQGPGCKGSNYYEDCAGISLEG